MDEKIFKIKLRYNGKEYICDGYGYFDEDCNEWRSSYEFDGVRNCEHDYACLLPRDVIEGKEFGCDQKEIEIVDDWWEDSK